MKRLVRRANEIITLYHGTCSQRLKDIHNSGDILLPNSETGILSSGLEGGDGFIHSLHTKGIYLGTESNAQGYADAAVYVDEVMPAFPLVFRVEVSTNNLLPDLDDLGKNYKFNETEEQWKQSLDTIQQVVHEGAINSNQIKGVRFSNNLDCIVPDVDYLYDDYLNEEVKKHLGKWYSISELIQIIDQFEQVIKKGELK